ncbi:hypothetical protein [Comamonas sp. lk]|uniref:hypothetical protein n=1 Tax=Comamonas sp. lk TaxID=2201272 RepID=UPI0013CE5BF4|nr:hypothetical protein [Comamonas sp. lk]
MPAGDTLPADTLGNALQVLLQGLVTSNNAGITPADTVLQALGKLQAQANAKVDKDGPKVLSDNNFTNSERVKLANIADGASNDRSKHTGAQAIATVEGLEGRLDAALRVKIITDATSTKDYLQKIVALGPGYYRHYVSIVELPNIPPESAGFLSVTGDTFSLLISSYSTADLTVISGTLNDIASGTWRVNVIGKSERGSNANGEYVKLPDGTMICTHTLSGIAAANATPVASLFRSNSQNWTFPAAFAAIPSVSHSESTGIGLAWTALGSVGITKTATSISLYSFSQGVATVCITAIGRWK